MEKRPRIKLKLKQMDKFLEIICVVLLIVIWVVVFSNFGDMPSKIPIHFDVQGHPNNYGNRRSLFITPIIATILYSFLTVLNKYPEVFNYRSRITLDNAYAKYSFATKMLRVLKLIIMFIFLFLEQMIVQSAQEAARSSNGWLLQIILAVLTVVSIYFVWRWRKLPKNDHKKEET